MGLYALVLILIEKCFKGRKNAYTVMWLACLALSLMTWGLDLAYALGVYNGKLTVGEFVARFNYLAHVTGLCLPVAVYCFVKAAVKDPKIYPLIPVLAVSVVLGILLSLLESIVRARVIDEFLSSRAVTFSLALPMLVKLLGSIVSGVCAVSWMKYISFGKAPAGGIDGDDIAENAYASPEKTEYSYLEEYKRKMKEEDR